MSIFFTRSIFSSTTFRVNIQYCPQYFHGRVFDVASADLYSMGIMVVSYTIKDVSDEVRKMAKLKDSMISC